MAKCIKCGGGFMTRGRIRLAHADICFKCFDSLGFDHKIDIYGSRDLKWSEIQVGKAAYQRNKEEAHKKWLEDHPDVVEFINVLNEEDEDEPATDATRTADEDNFDDEGIIPF